MFVLRKLFKIRDCQVKCVIFFDFFGGQQELATILCCGL